MTASCGLRRGLRRTVAIDSVSITHKNDGLRSRSLRRSKSSRTAASSSRHILRALLLLHFFADPSSMRSSISSILSHFLQLLLLALEIPCSSPQLGLRVGSSDDGIVRTRLREAEKRFKDGHASPLTDFTIYSSQTTPFICATLYACSHARA